MNERSLYGSVLFFKRCFLLALLSLQLIEHSDRVIVFPAPVFARQMPRKRRKNAKKNTPEIHLLSPDHMHFAERLMQNSALAISGKPDFLPTTARVLCESPHFGHFPAISGRTEPTVTQLL